MESRSDAEGGGADLQNRSDVHTFLSFRSSCRLKIAVLLEQALEARFTVHEDSPDLQRLAESAPDVTRFVEQVIGTLEELQDRCDSEDDTRNPETASLEEIGAQISAEAARHEISDLAFIAAMNLREAAAFLSRRQNAGEHTEIVTLCDAAMRNVRRALIPLENALCRMEGLPAPHRQPVDLDISLHTRRAYSTLRHDIMGSGSEVSAEQLPNALANAARRFRLLRASTVYPNLRLSDRLQMRSLCQRIRGWLGSTPQESNLEALNLWQDTVAFLQLLNGVNFRQELEVHDLEVASRALNVLSTAPKVRKIPDAVSEELQTLFGRNDEIDAMLVKPSLVTASAWAPALRRLCRDLRHVAEVRGTV